MSADPYGIDDFGVAEIIDRTETVLTETMWRSERGHYVADVPNSADDIPVATRTVTHVEAVVLGAHPIPGGRVIHPGAGELPRTELPRITTTTRWARVES